MPRRKEFPIETSNGRVITVIAETLADAYIILLKQRTLERNHQISFSEAMADEDFPHPNDYASFTEFTSFDAAASRVWHNLSPSSIET